MHAFFEFANYALTFVGVVVVIAATAAGIVALTDYIRDRRSEPHQPSFKQGQEYERQRLANDSWWFSEDAITMELLQDLANGVSVSDARENWRRKRG